MPSPIVDCDATFDIAFILDMSESIVYSQPQNWNIVKDFAVNVASSFPISPSASRVGVIKFSDNAEIEFYMNQYQDPNSLAVRRNYLTLIAEFELAMTSRAGHKNLCLPFS